MKLLYVPDETKKNNMICASHIYVSDESLKHKLASDMFEFMNVAYKYIGGFRSFTGEDDFADESYLWYITYDGPAPSDLSKIDINRVYTVSVFKQKFGLKMVGIGNNRFIGLPDDERKERKRKAKNAIREHIKFIAKRGWAEVSEACEKMFESVLPASYIIEPEELVEAGVFKQLDILPDNLHYARRLSNGMEVVKIAYGHIRY